MLMQKCYIISYDLRNKRDYEKLYDTIKSYSNWAHILESLWAVVTTQSAVEVRNKLALNMDSDDGLFVIQSSGIAAWKNVLCKDQWLKNNL